MGRLNLTCACGDQLPSIMMIWWGRPWYRVAVTCGNSIALGAACCIEHASFCTQSQSVLLEGSATQCMADQACSLHSLCAKTATAPWSLLITWLLQQPHVIGGHALCSRHTPAQQGWATADNTSSEAVDSMLLQVCRTPLTRDCLTRELVANGCGGG